ncbi:MAG: chromate transporter, partial [Alistipes sp.]|nr:chromate transporter [Alistipes sp.]
GEFLELLTVAQSAPGPIALNTAVFVGYKVRGYTGALASVLGVVIPSFVVILVVAIFFANIRENRVVDAAFKAMRPAVVALIVAPIIGLARTLNVWLIAVSVGVAAAVWWFGFSPIYLLVAGAAAGVAWSVWSAGKEGQR